MPGSQCGWRRMREGEADPAGPLGHRKGFTWIREMALEGWFSAEEWHSVKGTLWWIVSWMWTLRVKRETRMSWNSGCRDSAPVHRGTLHWGGHTEGGTDLGGKMTSSVSDRLNQRSVRIKQVEWPGVRVRSGAAGRGWALQAGFNQESLGCHSISHPAFHHLCLQIFFSLLDLCSMGTKTGSG